MTITQTAYDFHLTDIHDENIDLNIYKGKPLVIINTASFCKFTPQYGDLQDLWSIYKNWGLTIIAIPSGDFGRQEFETNKEIKNFCSDKYNISFVLAKKSYVKGKNAIPLFQWLAKEGGILAHPRWNFYKYLINRQGKLYTYFTSVSSPSSKRFINAIERICYDV